MTHRPAVIPQLAAIAAGGAVAAGIAGLVTYPLPRPWATWGWLAVTAAIGAALGVVGGRIER
jgi:hypothetical protein